MTPTYAINLAIMYATEDANAPIPNTRHAPIQGGCPVSLLL